MDRNKSYFVTNVIDQSVAGLTAGAVSTLVLHPIDLMKTKLQADEFRKNENRRLIGRSFNILRTTLNKEGIKGIYRGLSPNLAGSALSWSFYFGWYSIIKQRYHVELGDGRISQKLSSAQYMIASAQAGALTVLCTNPIWVVKTRMLTSNRTEYGAYKGLFDGLYRLIRYEGLRGMYRGLTPALFGTSHGALQFVAYEKLKGWKKSKLNENSNAVKMKDGLPVLDYLWMASLSKTFASVITYPYQVVKTRLQRAPKNGIIISGNDAKEYKSTLDTILRIHRNEGIQGFYKGLGPNTLRVLPGTCITFLVYETLSEWFRARAQEH